MVSKIPKIRFTIGSRLLMVLLLTASLSGIAQIGVSGSSLDGSYEGLGAWDCKPLANKDSYLNHDIICTDMVAEGTIICTFSHLNVLCQHESTDIDCNSIVVDNQNAIIECDSPLFLTCWLATGNLKCEPVALMMGNKLLPDPNGVIEGGGEILDDSRNTMESLRFNDVYIPFLWEELVLGMPLIVGVVAWNEDFYDWGCVYHYGIEIITELAHATIREPQAIFEEKGVRIQTAATEVSGFDDDVCIMQVVELRSDILTTESSELNAMTVFQSEVDNWARTNNGVQDFKQSNSMNYWYNSNGGSQGLGSVGRDNVGSGIFGDPLCQSDAIDPNLEGEVSSCNESGASNICSNDPQSNCDVSYSVEGKYRAKVCMPVWLGTVCWLPKAYDITTEVNATPRGSDGCNTKVKPYWGNEKADVETSCIRE